MRSSDRRVDLVAVGHACVDLVAVVPHLPHENRKLEVPAVHTFGGGPAATAALTVRRLGASSAFLGQVGSGPLADVALAELRVAGVDLDGVDHHPTPGGRVAMVLVDARSAARTIVFTRSGLPGLAGGAIDSELIAGAGLLLVDDLDIPAAIVAARHARDAGVPVLLDAGTPRQGIDVLVPLCDVVIAAAHFLPGFLDIEEPLDGLRALRASGPRVVGVTCGEDGAILWDGSICLRQPAFETAVVDTTGAGDVFHGAFAYGLLEGWEMRRTLRFAAAAAALSCTVLGAQGGVPSRQAVEALLERGETQ